MTTERIPATASALDLAPHPEGGWFRRTWTAPARIDTDRGPRPAATCIHYLLTPGQTSAWHVVTSDEIWLWHGPGMLDIHLGGDGDRVGEATTMRLGPDLSAGHLAQVLVPAHTWQSATLVADIEALVSCVVSPGFDYADWSLAGS